MSASGGRRPVWAPDGKQLFYWEGSCLVAATLRFGPTPRVVSRASLFDGRYEDDYDVAPAGNRFLMIESETSGLSLVVAPNWRTELRRLITQVTR